MEEMNEMNQVTREEEFCMLGLWCAANLEYIQEEIRSEERNTMAFRESGAALYSALIQRGWTPPPLKK